MSGSESDRSDMTVNGAYADAVLMAAVTILS